MGLIEPQITKSDALPLRQAAVVVWMILSACGAGVILAPWLLPGDLLLRWSSMAQAPHLQCPFCGMTRALLWMSSGDPDRAGVLNRGGLPLYSIAVANTLWALVYAGRSVLGGRAARHWRSSAEPPDRRKEQPWGS